MPRSAPVSLPIVLLTGFEPFAGASVNPSWQASRALHGRVLGGHRVIAAQLPVEFGRALDRLDMLLERHRPALVITTGQAGGRAAISLERVAINVDDARIPDNAGRQPVDTPVVAGGPAAYFSTLPIKAMHAAMQAGGWPGEVSQTAGTFVCNHVFYGLMHRLASDPRWAATRGGCVHVPWMDGQGTPSLALDRLVGGLECAIRAALAHAGADLRVQAGATH